MLRSLLRYAGLDQMRLRIELEGADGRTTIAAGQEWTVDRTYRHSDAAAWFMSAGDDECVFGVAEELLGNPNDLVGILAHEVAHAFRSRHGLEYRTRREEEPLTDLTTVYLGFGILRTRSAVPNRPDPNVPEWERIEYMQPRFLAFALGAQAVARDVDDSGLKRIARYLDPNAKADFSKACEALRLQRAGLLEQLGIGGINAGMPVFRVVGRWPFKSARCSDPTCNARIPSGVANCPGCGGIVSGDVGSRQQALERESTVATATDDLSKLLKGE